MAVQYSSSVVQVFPFDISQAVLILGFSEQGPTGRIIYVHNPREAVSVYGKGMLVDAYQQAYAAGGRQLYLLRLEGSSYEEVLPQVLPALYELSFVYYHFPGLYFNNSFLVGQLWDFCQTRSALGENTHVILGVAPCLDGDVASWVNSLLAVAEEYNHFLTDGESQGYFFSAVAAQVNGNSFGPAATYAGLAAGYPPQVDLTNKSTGLTGLDLFLDDEQCRALADVGYVIFVPTVRRGIAVYRAVTMAAPDSSFCSFTDYRVAVDVVEDLKQLGQDYLGLPPAAAVTNAKIGEAINQKLLAKVRASVLRDYAFLFNYENNTVDLNLVLVPYSSASEIKVNTTIFLT